MEDINDNQNEGGQTVDKGRSRKGPDHKKIYGDRFDGFSKVSDLRHLILVFKDFYFAEKKKDVERKQSSILREFNDKIAPERFFPYPSQVSAWCKKWDEQILLEVDENKRALMEKRRIRDLVQIRDEGRSVTLVPGDEDLERGSNTLAGALLNDAMQTLQDTQEMEEIYTSDELTKRKKYVLNVLSEITRKVQGKENLKIKKAAEGREQAGFLMNLLNRAKSGQVSDNDLATLKSAVIDVPATPVE